MDFGVPKEVRPFEQRVGLTPAGAFALAQEGHRVYVQRDAGLAAGFRDQDYQTVGAQIVYSAEEAYGRAEVVLKVVRPVEAEYPLFAEGQTLMCYLHLAVASKDLHQALRQARMTAIAYERIADEDGTLPVLLPTSQVVGRMAPIIAGQYLESTHGGLGILLSGVPGVPSAEVVIIGAGVVGLSAARAFLGLGAQLTILDQDFRKLDFVDEKFSGAVNTLMSTPYNLARVLRFANVVVGAVLTPGKRTPVILTREMIRQMRPRSVFIDFSIDQGGCIATSKPCTHDAPSYVQHGVIHSAITNLPAAAPQIFFRLGCNYLIDIVLFLLRDISGMIGRL